MNTLAYHAMLVSLASFLFTFYLVPKIIDIVRFKKLMDNPNERSSHQDATPSLGGIAFYFVFILSLYFNNTYDTFNIAMSLIPGLTILLFLGLKDDLIVLAPRTKLIGQIVACIFVLAHYKFEIGSFHGFLGIHGMPVWLSFGLALVIRLTIINAFNLIDGIDGLAASIGIVAFASFAIFYFFIGRNFLGLSSLVMLGILSGFLVFNLSTKRKIFMGDTGSLLLGFLIAVMSIRFLALENEDLNKLPFNKINIPILLVSFMIIPLFDTLRVFTIRMLAGKSPFSPDRNHLHHLFIDKLSISHRRASFYIAGINGTMVLAVYVLIRLTNIWITTAVIMLILTYASVVFAKWSKTRKVREINLRKRTKMRRELQQMQAVNDEINQRLIKNN